MKTKINIGLLLLSILLYAGCGEDFLNIEPPSSLTSNSFYKTAADAESAVNAAYAPLQTRSMYSDLYPKVTGGGTDDILVNNTGGLSFNTWTFNASISFIDEVWQACYEGIFRSNLVLQHVPDIDMDESQKSRIIGEARFLRALYYWHLSTLFGEVPVVKEADPEDISKAEVAKSSLGDIYDLMISDLNKASASLPLRSGYGKANLGRATKGAAQSLLGKIYLYDENYPLAEMYLDSVIDSNEYQLIDDFSNLWVNDNDAESIFEVQYANVGGDVWSSADGPNVNESNLRLELNLPQGRGGFGNLLPTQDLVDEFEDYSGSTAINGRDPRLFYSVFRDGDPYDQIEPVYSEDWTPTGYTMKKGMVPIERDQDNNTRNIVLIRLADVMLMDAEAANENGKPSKAISLLNEVRDRPSVQMPHYPTPEYPVGNKQDIFSAIVHERRVELAFEFQRLNDLRRWGLAAQELGPLGYVSPKHRYFPIPRAEVDTNPELEQNSEYN